MSEIPKSITEASIGFCSSLSDNAWHAQTGRGAYESWRFDALSDDGREVIVIVFYDNYPFASGYYDHAIKGVPDPDEARRFPAVSFCYSVDGRVVMQAVNELRSGEFSAATNEVNCSIGKSSFRMEKADYGTGFLIKIDLMTVRRRRIAAELEWLSVESDLLADDKSEHHSVLWNMAAPRSDVSGRVTLIGSSGAIRRKVQFRGTGSHDHFRSEASMLDRITSGFWGRAHFTDATAVFYRLVTGTDRASEISRIFLIRDGAMHERKAEGDVQRIFRSRYGHRVPQRLSLITEDNMRLRVKPLNVIQDGVLQVRLLSSMTLTLRDGKPRTTVGITEFVVPCRVKSRLLRWVAGLRVGKDGRPPLF